MSIKNHLDDKYHTAQFLRDRILASADTSYIKSAFHTGSQLPVRVVINKVANHLSSKPRSTVRNIACLMEREEDFSIY